MNLTRTFLQDNLNIYKPELKIPMNMSVISIMVTCWDNEATSAEKEVHKDRINRTVKSQFPDATFLPSYHVIKR